MDLQPCTESQLRDEAEEEHNGSLNLLHQFIRHQLAKQTWPPVRWHMQQDLIELDVMIRHDEWLRTNA